MFYRILGIVVVLMALGCATAQFYAPGQKGEDPVEVGKVTMFGNGCAVVTYGNGTMDVLLQHAGMSMVLGGTLRSITSVAGEVFGGSPQEQGELRVHEGCAGVFESGNGSDEIELTDEEIAEIRERAARGFLVIPPLPASP